MPTLPPAHTNVKLVAPGGKPSALLMAPPAPPLNIVLNLVLLSPTRYWALAKLFDNRWQTRQAPETAAELT